MMMKKAFASIALFLLLAGCLPFAPSAGVKGGTDKGTDGEETLAGRPEDSVATGDTAGPEAGAVQAGPIAPEVANRIAFAEQGPIEPKSEVGEANPLTRFAPPPPPTDSGPLAFAKAGPIDPKSEVAEALPGPCLLDRLRYGADLSSVLRCSYVAPDVTLPEGGEKLDLKLLLERNTSGARNAPDDQWVPQADGFQVRLVYLPRKSEDWTSAQYVDAVTASSTSGHNVVFPPLALEWGLLRFYVFKQDDAPARSPDFQTDVLKTFPDRESYFALHDADIFQHSGFVSLWEINVLGPQILRIIPDGNEPAQATPAPPQRDWRQMIRLIKEIDLSLP